MEKPTTAPKAVIKSVKFITAFGEIILIFSSGVLFNQASYTIAATFLFFGIFSGMINDITNKEYP